MRYKLFFVKAISKLLWKLMKLTKQLITIIIVIRISDYNKQVLIASSAISKF